MKRCLAILATILGLVPAALAGPASPSGRTTEGGAAVANRTLKVPRFGTVHIVRNVEHPPRVLILVSGDNGWDRRMSDMASAMAGLDALVIGVDVLAYLRTIDAGTSCPYLAADFEALSQAVQRRLGRPDYATPALAGYSSGATIVYAALVEAPPGTFATAFSLGFCADLPMARAPCRGHGLATHPGRGRTIWFEPAPGLEVPWVVLSGDGDKACPAGPAEAFAAKVPAARSVRLPRVGHGFRESSDWLPQMAAEWDRIQPRPGTAARDRCDPSDGPVLAREDLEHEPAPPAEGPAAPPVAADDPEGEPRDLPVVELPVEGEGGGTFAVILSGDGGWASIDREIGKVLAGRGIPVAGLNSLKYFWQARTPEGAADDLAWIVRHYARVWHRDRVVLIGYSFGADVLPFLYNRLPDGARRRVVRLGLVGPSRTATFEFHVGDWIGGDSDEARPTLPETRRVSGPSIVCLYGTDEHDSLCPALDDVPSVRGEALPGGHHFGGDYEGLARRLLDGL